MKSLPLYPKLIDNIAKRVIPSIYDTVDIVGEGHIDYMIRKDTKWNGGNYLSISIVDSLDNSVNWKEIIRTYVFNKYNAKRLINEFRLQIVLIILNENEKIDYDIKADTFGNHSVIVQGIHLFDLHNRNYYSNQTKWFSIPFSNADAINTIIYESLAEVGMILNETQQ